MKGNSVIFWRCPTCGYRFKTIVENGFGQRYNYGMISYAPCWIPGSYPGHTCFGAWWRLSDKYSSGSTVA